MIYIILLLWVVFSFLIIKIKNFIHAVILFGICNSLASFSYFLLQAPDVALTEASIGTCLSTLIFIIALKKIGVYKE